MDTLRRLGLALLLTSAVAVSLLSGNSLRYEDEQEYHALAVSILHDHVFSVSGADPTVFRPPGYPALLSGIYTLVESPLAAKLLNAVLLVLLAACIAAPSARLDPRARALVPYMMLCYPLLLYAASLVYPQILGALLLAATVALVSRTDFKSTHAAAAGAIYGYLILTIPSFLMLLPLLDLFILLRRGESFSASLRRCVVMTALALAVLAPWTIRNYEQFHAFVPVSANSGINLLLGNSAATRPATGVSEEVLRTCPLLGPGMTTIEADAAARKCAVEWIRSNPGAAALLYLEKTANYFSYRNEIATTGESLPWRDRIMLLTYYPLLLIAILRAACFRRIPLTRRELLIYLLYFGNAFASAIFFTRLRFRIPFDCLLVSIDSAFLVTLWDWSVAHQARRRAEAPIG